MMRNESVGIGLRIGNDEKITLTDRGDGEAGFSPLGRWGRDSHEGEDIPGDSVSGNAAPGGAAPGGAVSGSAAPGEAVPGGAVSGGAAPGEAVPGEAVPGSAAPGEAAPDNAVSVNAAPDNADSGKATPGGTVSLNAAPGTAVSVTAASGTAAPGTATPGIATPGTATPGGPLKTFSFPGGTDTVKDGQKEEGNIFTPMVQWWGRPETTPFMKAGVVAGAVLALAAFVAAVIFLVKGRRNRHSKEETPMEPMKGTDAGAPLPPPGSDEPVQSTEEPYVPEQPAASVSRTHGVYIGKVHNIGGREDQQDSFGISDMDDTELVRRKGIMAIVADGMGGLSFGGEVSQLVTLTMMQYFYENVMSDSPDRELLRMLNLANDQVMGKLGPQGKGKSGSTLVATLVKDGSLYWIAVGDSHIYLYRNHALMQLNREHVYGVDLDERAARGEISFREAAADPQRKALTSFIGMGRITKIDRNIRPLRLMEKDRVLLMTDGVFGSLTDDEIVLAMDAPAEESARAIHQMIQEKRLSGQDNYTAVILEFL